MKLYAVTNYAERSTARGISISYSTGYLIAPDEATARKDALKACKEHFEGYDAYQVSVTEIKHGVILTDPATGKLYHISVDEVKREQIVLGSAGEE